MRTRWLVSMTAALPAALLASDASSTLAHDEPLRSRPTSAELELRAVDAERLKLYASGERRALAELVDDDFRYTGPNGDWLNKREFIDLQWKTRLADVTHVGDSEVRAFGEVGVIVGAFSYAGPQGARITTRYTDVYRRDTRTWRLVNEQHSIIADPTQLAMNSANDPFHAPWRGAEPRGEDGPVLLELNRGYVQAFLDSNVAWYDAHLAPDYLVVFGDGSLHDKGSLLEAASHPVTNMKSFPTESVTVRRFGNVALIHAENPYVRTDGLRGVNRYTDLWHKRNGRWMCVGAHVTRHKLPS